MPKSMTTISRRRSCQILIGSIIIIDADGKFGLHVYVSAESVADLFLEAIEHGIKGKYHMEPPISHFRCCMGKRSPIGKFPRKMNPPPYGQTC
jgi:hypothetical protein